MMAALALSRVGGILRETGQALERFGYDLGWVYTGLERYREHIFRSQPVSPVNGAAPQVHKNAFIAPSANVTGDVKIGKGSSVFYNTVIRGDAAPITIGEGTNLQDGCTVSTSMSGVGQAETAVTIGHNVTVGHAATLRGCTVQDGAFVGIGACVMEGAVVECGAMVAAGAVVLPGCTVPAAQVWAGNPAKCLRELKPEEAQFLPRSAGLYTDLAKQHRATCQKAIA
jgi:carbonic anhydrase/acetyltransferase-like protein (isoleucine patch superfamily)